MKVSCIRVSTDLLIGKKSDTVTNYLAKEFLGLGVVIDNILTIQNNPKNIFSALNFVEQEIIFIIGENTANKNYGIKKSISTHLQLELVKNELAIENVNNYYKQENSPVMVESENEYYVPQNAQVFSSHYSPLQSFLIENNDKTYIFLPDNLKLVKTVFEQHLKQYLQKHNTIKYKQTIIKTFGIYEKDIYSILGDMVRNIYKITFITYPNNLEVTLVMRYNENIDEEIIRTFTAKVYEKLKKFIYADEDVTLAKRAIDLLEIGNRTVAIAEGVSQGEISSKINLELSSQNSSLIKYSVVCPNTESKIKLLGMSQGMIDKFGEVSIETAYEMAVGLLEKSGADFVVCTTGISESQNDNDKKITFISVGDEDGIHVYKNTFIGDKQTVIENISQTSLFYLIKNIKQNDLLFSENIV